MFHQHINNIPLGSNIFMKEFFLQPGESAPLPTERDILAPKEREMHQLVETYHDEHFLEVYGKTIPAIFEGTYRLADITMETLDEPFEPGQRFAKALNSRKKRALEKLIKSGGHDGKNVSVRDWHFSEQEATLIGQAMTYTQFKATDAAQDDPLRPDDQSFPDGVTLRDYVVVNGRESRKGTDVLSNLLGAAFIVKAKGENGQDYFVLGRRQRGRTSEGGELSVIGGTPMWEEKYFGNGPADFAGYMRKLGEEEHQEELLLNRGEIDIGNNVHLLRTLVRVFDPFYTVDVDPSITVEEIAARCYGNEEALKEHDRLYALPQSKEALQGLMNNRLGFNIGQGTIAGLYLDIQEK
ncbi:MAG: hypothetical protein Q8R37_01515 [Nanoarchaeota archaeon]|nr:hypothetical protein [Nanoarchaeota archaeon]